MYENIATFLLKNCSVRPVVGIICGSGLSSLSESIENSVTFKYEDIPGFPHATVPGHTGELVFGTVGGIECVCMRGRFHYYEGNSMERVVLPVRVRIRFTFVAHISSCSRLLPQHIKLSTLFCSFPHDR